MKRLLHAGFLGLVLAAVLMCVNPTYTYAADTPIDPKFDYQYYADTYPDLKAAFGYDQNALWNHYVTYGQFEKRMCFKGDTGGTLVVGGADAAAQNVTAPTGEELDAAAEIYDQLMLEKVNAYRASYGLEPLQFKKKVNDVARVRVNESTLYFEHQRPDGRKFWTTYDDLGYKSGHVGENQLCIQDNWNFNVDGDANAYVQYVFEGYVASPSHNRAMLRPYWKYFGSAFITNSNGNCYNVQEFATS